MGKKRKRKFKKYPRVSKGLLAAKNSPIRVTGLLLDGFSASNAEPGEQVQVTVKHSALSTEPLFYIYAIQIINIISKKTPLHPGAIQKLLVVIHSDNEADVYLNDFLEQVKIKPNKNFKAGDKVYLSDITDIAGLKFPDVHIKSDDKVIYIDRFGFIFGFYFNFSREITEESISDDLGKLKRELLLEDHLQKSKAAYFRYGALIFTEGKTDVLHLKKAAKDLGTRLVLKYDDSDQDFGDGSLLAACKLYARKLNPEPIICIFDRDNEEIIRKLEAETKDGKDYQDWGNNVFSFLLPKPSHREEYNRISIEMYYRDDFIRRKDQSGKRLHFTNEVEKIVSPTTGRLEHYRVLPVIREHEELDKKVVSDYADKIVDDEGVQCAISKTYFANNVYVEADNFQNADFSEFKKVFALIEKILDENR